MNMCGIKPSGYADRQKAITPALQPPTWTPVPMPTGAELGDKGTWPMAIELQSPTMGPRLSLVKKKASKTWAPGQIQGSRARFLHKLSQCRPFTLKSEDQ